METTYFSPGQLYLVGKRLQQYWDGAQLAVHTFSWTEWQPTRKCLSHLWFTYLILKWLSKSENKHITLVQKYTILFKIKFIIAQNFLCTHWLNFLWNCLQHINHVAWTMVKDYTCTQISQFWNYLINGESLYNNLNDNLQMHDA